MYNCPNITSNIIEEQGRFYYWYNIVINRIICNFLVAFGIISNILILFVFATSRQLLAKPLVRYFIGLSVFDLFVISGTWLLISWKIFNVVPSLGNHVYAIYCVSSNDPQKLIEKSELLKSTYFTGIKSTK